MQIKNRFVKKSGNVNVYKFTYHCGMQNLVFVCERLLKGKSTFYLTRYSDKTAVTMA